jgi:hypothetical protein
MERNYTKAKAEMIAMGKTIAGPTTKLWLEALTLCAVASCPLIVILAMAVVPDIVSPTTAEGGGTTVGLVIVILALGRAVELEEPVSSEIGAAITAEKKRAEAIIVENFILF